MRSRAWSTAAVFVFFSLFFLVLRSNNLTGEDGADRSASVYFASAPFLHGNNHLLYPVNLWLYMAAHCSIFGRAADAFAYFERAATLNAWLGGAALALVCWLVSELSGITSAGVAAAATLGFSAAFGLNATHPNEPMPGFFMSLLAAAASYRGLSGGSPLWCLLSGVLLAYAMACYQSMASWLPGIALPYVVGKSDRRRLLLLLLGFSLGAVAVFGMAHALVGEGWRSGMRRIFALDGGGERRLYGGFEPKQVVALPFGFLQAAFALPYSGLRATFAEAGAGVWIQWLAAAAIVGVAGGLTVREALRGRPPTVLAFGAAAAISVLCPLLWNVSYSKLWLQPLSAGFAAWAVAAWGRRASRLAFLGLAAALAVWNTTQLFVPNHRGHPEVVQAAHQVDEGVPQDATVFRGWDPVSITWAEFFPQQRRHIFDVPGSAYFLSGTALGTRIAHEIAVARRENREVFFLGLLEMSEAEWATYLGHRAGVSFASFESYRQRARALLSFSLSHGRIGLDVLQDP